MHTKPNGFGRFGIGLVGLVKGLTHFLYIIGVSLTHYNMVANLSQLSHPEVLIEGLRNLENQETTVAVLPFFHIYAMNCIMTFGLRLGGKLVTVPRFEPEMYISCLVNYKVSTYKYSK